MNLYVAEKYTVITSGEQGWCVKRGDDTVCDVYEGQAMAEKIASLLNAAGASRG